MIPMVGGGRSTSPVELTQDEDTKKKIQKIINDEFPSKIQRCNYLTWLNSSNRSTLKAEVRYDGEKIASRRKELMQPSVDEEKRKNALEEERRNALEEKHSHWKIKKNQFEEISWGVKALKTGAIAATLTAGAAAFFLRSNSLLAIAATIAAFAATIFAYDLHKTQSRIDDIINVLNVKTIPENIDSLVFEKIQEVGKKTLFVNWYLKRHSKGETQEAVLESQTAAAYALFSPYHLRFLKFRSNFMRGLK